VKLVRGRNVALVALFLLANSVPAGAAAVSATPLSLPAGALGVYQGYLPALACSSEGNCVAGGTYNAANNAQGAVLLTQIHGTWQTGAPLALPAGASLPTLLTLSCGSGDSCSGIGTAQTSASVQASLVVSQSNGAWGTAQILTLPAHASTSGQNSQPHGINCVATGTCAVVGTYNAGAATLGYLAFERAGAWGRASQIVLPAAHNVNPQVTASQVSCWAPGACVAVGSFVTSNGVTQAFTVTSTNYQWHSAQLVTLPISASAYSDASLSEVTCVGAGSCTAVGSFTTTSGTLTPMAVTMAHGAWGQAVAIHLPSGAASSGATFLWGYAGVSCVTPGTCAFGGDYLTQSGQHQGFLVNEVKNVWQSALTLPLPSGALYAGTNGGVIDVSCTTSGTCTAAAAYVDSSKLYQAMTISETAGTWGAPRPITMPGGATTVGVDGGIYGLACFADNTCQITGSYLARTNHYQGFAAVS